MIELNSSNLCSEIGPSQLWPVNRPITYVLTNQGAHQIITEHNLLPHKSCHSLWPTLKHLGEVPATIISWVSSNLRTFSCCVLPASHIQWPHMYRRRAWLFSKMSESCPEVCRSTKNFPQLYSPHSVPHRMLTTTQTTWIKGEPPNAYKILQQLSPWTTLTRDSLFTTDNTTQQDTLTVVSTTLYSLGNVYMGQRGFH